MSSLFIKTKKINFLKRISSLWNERGKLRFIFFFALFLIGAFLLSYDFYMANTEIAPSIGGLMREGAVGQPRFINPIYAESNDIDRDLVALIFSGLMKYDQEGKIVYDLTTHHEVKEGGKIYEIEITKSAKFHDGIQLDAEDIVFTIKTIQNPDFKSPLLVKWTGVEVEKINDHRVRFTLQNAYPAFLENLTIKILPSHIWEKILPQNFPLSNYNFNPVGSGPYFLKNISKNNEGFIQNVILERNDQHHSTAPNIAQIKISFYKNEDDLISDALAGFLDTFSLVSPKNYAIFQNLQKNSFILPRYFSLFFNAQENKHLQTKEIREALSISIDKIEIKDNVLFNEGAVVDSPLLPEIYNFGEAEEKEFNPQKAKELLIKSGLQEKDGKITLINREQKMTFAKNLDVGSRGQDAENLQKCLAMFEDVYPEKEITGIFGLKTKAAVINFQNKYPDEILRPAGLKSGNGKVGAATREKLNKVCVISPETTTPFVVTITTANDPLLEEIARNIQNQWQRIGIEAKISVYEISEIKQHVIKDRKYEILLFGQILGVIPDPFSFWHSSQRSYPGLNLSNYQNKNLDKILEEMKTSADPESMNIRLKNAQKILIEDSPAIFLCNPYYVYFSPDKIKGISPGLIADPSERFSNIQNWHISTKRVFK